MTITGEHVATDRARRKLSRPKYADLVGLTPTKVHNIEKGRELTAEETELVRPFVADIIGEAPPLAGFGPNGGASLENGTPLPVQGLDEPVPVAPVDAAPSGASEEALAPVVLITEEEIEEDEVEDVTPLPGSGLPRRYDFTLEGYHASNSELATHRRCLRKWWLAYYRELRLREPDVVGARALGTRLHVSVAAYYSTRREDPLQVLEYTIAEDTALLESRGEDLTELKKDADLARAMMEGYLQWVRETGADEGLEVLGDEVVVESPFMSAEQTEWQPVVLVGKMDLRLRRTYDQARLFLDHKSVGSFQEARKTLHMDTQMLHYHLLEYLDCLQRGMTAVEAQDNHTMGGLYNMLRKVKRTPQAKPPFFDRIEVRHNIHELASYWHRVWGEVLDIVKLRGLLDAGAEPNVVAYPNPRSTCAWDCDFFPVCPMFDDGSAAEEMLGAYYDRHDPHDHYYPYGELESQREGT